MSLSEGKIWLNNYMENPLWELETLLDSFSSGKMLRHGSFQWWTCIDMIGNDEGSFPISWANPQGIILPLPRVLEGDPTSAAMFAFKFFSHLCFLIEI